MHCQTRWRWRDAFWSVLQTLQVGTCGRVEEPHRISGSGYTQGVIWLAATFPGHRWTSVGSLRLFTCGDTRREWIGLPSWGLAGHCWHSKKKNKSLLLFAPTFPDGASFHEPLSAPGPDCLIPSSLPISTPVFHQSKTDFSCSPPPTLMGVGDSLDGKKYRILSICYHFIGETLCIDSVIQSANRKSSRSQGLKDPTERRQEKIVLGPAWRLCNFQQET